MNKEQDFIEKSFNQYMKYLQDISKIRYPEKSRWFHIDKALEYHLMGIPEDDTSRS